MLKFLLILGESFHIIAHLNILLRIHPPNLITLKGKRLYFVYDMTNALISFLYLYPVNVLLQICVFLHEIAHLFYVYYWNTGSLAIRIRDWSTSEYTGKWITTDFFLTCFDIITHSMLLWHLLF